MRRFKLKRVLSCILLIAIVSTTFLSQYIEVFAYADNYGQSQKQQNIVLPNSNNGGENISISPDELKQKPKILIPQKEINPNIVKTEIKNNNKKYDTRENTQIIVKYKNSSNSDQVKNKVKGALKLSKFQSKRKYSKGKVELLEIAINDNIDKVIGELKKDSNIEFAQPNYKLEVSETPQDSRFNYQWGLSNTGQTISSVPGIAGVDINAVKAWDITKGNSSVVVGIIDTGVDVNHSDLKNNIYINTKEVAGNGVDDDGNGYIDDVSGWDFADKNNTVYDNRNDSTGSNEDKHGTHVAGIITASANSIGIRGVAPSVKIMPLKFIKGNDCGLTSDAIEAVEYAKSMGIKIVNCSWGGSDYNAALKDAMQNSDILFVCAAGNSGTSTPTMYPACFDLPNMITVASINNRGFLSSFSNSGSLVHVAAPGENIYSTLPGSTYGYLSGTSMAAPHVAGVAALIKSANAGIATLDIAYRIKDSAVSTPELYGRVISGGRVDAYSALIKNSTISTKPSQARYGHSAADLNGMMYIVGGYDGKNYLNSVESYIPASNKWVSKNALNVARTSLGTVSCNGKIYAIGGYNGTASNVVEEYDPSQDKWTVKSSMPTARYAFGIAESDGKIYVIGGWDGNNYLDTVEEYDPYYDRWTTRKPMLNSRAYIGAASINGKIYVVGGKDNQNNSLKTVDEYDINNDSWTNKASLLSGRRSPNVLEVNGKLLVFNGVSGDFEKTVEAYKTQSSSDEEYFNAIFSNSSVEEYDIVNGIWNTRNQTSSLRTYTGAVRINNDVYFSCGWLGTSLNTVEKYSVLSSPKNIHASSIENTIKVLWDKVPEAVSYEIEIDGSTRINTGANTYYQHTGINLNEQHTYRVRALKNSEESAWSNSISKSIYDSITGALKINLNTTVTGILSTEKSEMWYRITPDTAGMMSIDLSNIPANCDYEIALYGNDGNKLINGEEVSSLTNTITNINVDPINYYIRIYSVSGYSTTQAFSLGTVFTPKSEIPIPEKMYTCIVPNSTNGLEEMSGEESFEI